MLCKFWAVKFKMEVAKTWYWPMTKQPSTRHSIFWSLHLSVFDTRIWVNTRHRNISAYSKLNPVQTLQSSRSKSTTYPRKGLMSIVWEIWSTWSWALGPDSATRVGLVDRQWLQRLYSFSAIWLEKSIVFPCIVENNEKTGTHTELFQMLVPRTGL